ncbi:MAG: tRNA (adenosine(37)-N6)-threonylcarbamoyltransferase complex ATPase subunit type 1 TsaE [Defluviitaleaceae bacterium]|nr:tRNA (adenosine(37)-N6)-threonylcarbamoyltransferase complex ATPase subunit type 1 TsaE [Defluviitaleaceae bacterium]
MDKYISNSPEESARIAAEIAKNTAPGDIFCLSGPLGAGKTIFAQGFAAGLGYTGQVTSPTFTILQIYEGGRLPMYHFDLYRLEGGIAELEGIGYEEYFYADGVTLIEWPEMAPEAIPAEAIRVEIQGDMIGDYREIIVV